MKVALTWRTQEPPRLPVAVLGGPAVAASLAWAVHRQLETGADLQLAATDGHLLVVGPEHALPWVDNGTWLGTEDGVLVPTTASPSVSPDLLRRALGDQVGARRMVIVPGRVLLFTTGADPDPGWLMAFAQRSVA